MTDNEIKRMKAEPREVGFDDVPDTIKIQMLRKMVQSLEERVLELEQRDYPMRIGGDEYDTPL